MHNKGALRKKRMIRPSRKTETARGDNLIGVIHIKALSHICFLVYVRRPKSVFYKEGSAFFFCANHGKYVTTTLLCMCTLLSVKMQYSLNHTNTHTYTYTPRERERNILSLYPSIYI